MVATLPSLNRRQWLKSTVASAAALAVTERLLVTPAQAQHEVKKGAKRAEVVRLSGNENPFGPSQMATMAMMQALERSFRYAFAETQTLVKAIAELEGVAPENIVMGVGSGEILEIYGVYLGQQKGEVITVTPGYLQMVGAMERMGSKVIAVPLNDKLEHDLDAMAAKITPNTKCVYICNPNNPTGTIVDAAKLKAFCIEVSKKCPVFVDEAYLQCTDNFAANTMVGLVKEGHNVTVARTFSKLYGLAGQRIGYGVTKPETAKAIKEFSTGSLNLLGVVAATASLEDKAYFTETQAKIKAGRTALVDVIKGLGKKYAEPNGNFVFFQTGMPIKTFQEKMLAEGVQVARPFAPMLDWARVTIGLPEEMTICHAALKKVLG
jgi:histidinol-phosphate aminotransferase